MTTILSTKKLNHSQREHLLHAGLAVVDFDFIATEKIDFKLPKQPIENVIFTSQNGVNAVFEKDVKIENCFCVGMRTQKLLENKNQKVIFAAKNAEALSSYIIEKASNKTYTYFCAKDRLDTLPNNLSLANVDYREVPVYKTIYTPKKYGQQFNGVLFFSPSGVESYFSVNEAAEHSFCIGNTTAKALKKYTHNYTVASQTTVENVLVKVIKHFKSND